MNDIKIECVQSYQWQRVKRLRLAALTDAPDAFGSTLADTEKLSDDDWIKGVEELTTFIASSDQQDVGMVRCVPHNEKPGCAFLISLWVVPEARKSGAGVLLVQSVIDWATQKGYKDLSLDVANDNAAAIALYEKLLFLPTGKTDSLPYPREHILEHRLARKL